MAAAVSGAVGFTAEPNESTIGVSATARPTSATRGEAIRDNARTANATNNAVMSTVTKRMMYTAPGAVGHRREIPPTTA
jgi:hypothetical protein